MGSRFVLKNRQVDSRAFFTEAPLVVWLQEQNGRMTDDFLHFCYAACNMHDARLDRKRKKREEAFMTSRRFCVPGSFVNSDYAESTGC
jgi:hypothetical protein